MRSDEVATASATAPIRALRLRLHERPIFASAPANYGAGADPSYTPILPLGTLTISATGPGEIIFDALYDDVSSPDIPPAPIHEIVVQVVPEPGAAALLALGLVVLGLRRLPGA